MALTQLWVLCTLTHGMLLKVGLKEQRERENKSKVTQEPLEKNTINTSKKRRESLTQMNKQGKIAR